MSRHIVANAAEIPPGGCKLVTVNGRELGIFNLKGAYYAVLNRCPHAGAALCKGHVVGLSISDSPGEYRLERPGEMLKCPWHGWEFDIRTGQSWCDPQKIRVPSFPLAVEHGADIVQGPYVAETFPVSVEDDYLVLEA